MSLAARPERTSWVTNATAVERRAWQTSVYGDDDDVYEQVYEASTPYLPVSRFTRPKRSHWSPAGPFVYPGGG